MADQQLTPAEIRLAQYGQRTSTWSTATYNDGTEKALHEIALGLKAEVDRLRAELANAPRPHTPRLCQCGHSHLAHTVPAPHSCFAHGQTCPCPAYQQLPHDEAVAQLKCNQQAAAERKSACNCPHPDDAHSIYGCEDGCSCEWMPKRKPMDPVHILGLYADDQGA